MAKIDIVKIDKDYKKSWQIILGGFLIIAGLILLIPYLIKFLKILIAIAIIALGIFVLSKNKTIREFFFKF